MRSGTKLEKVHPPNFTEDTESRRKKIFGDSRYLRRFSAGKFLLFCKALIIGFEPRQLLSPGGIAPTRRTAGIPRIFLIRVPGLDSKKIPCLELWQGRLPE
jgi:hypothetical protein